MSEGLPARKAALALGSSVLTRRKPLDTELPQMKAIDMRGEQLPSDRWISAKLAAEVQAQSVALLLQTHHPVVTVVQVLQQLQILAAILMQAAVEAVLIVEREVPVVVEAEVMEVMALELLEQ